MGGVQMNRIQRMVLASFLTLTVIELILVYIYDTSALVRCVQFSGTVLLFMIAAIVKKEYREQKILVFGFLFSVIGDFFMILLPVIRKGANADLFGIVSFLLSYVFIIWAFNRNFRIKLSDGLLALPFISAVVYYFATMLQYIKGVMIIAVLLFSLTITIMAWTSVCTLVRGYFTRRVAIIAAIAAAALFLSDMGVAYALFYPPLKGSVWLEIFIRATYVPAWTLLLVIVCEKNIRMDAGEQ
jgi:hypothetical protein